MKTHQTQTTNQTLLILTFAIICSAMLSLTACQTNHLSKNDLSKIDTNPSIQNPLNNSKVDYQVLLKSSYDDFGSITQNEAYQKIIEDSKTFQQEFAKFSKSLAPSIDFSKQRVVMDSLGLLRSGSTETTIKQVYDDGEFIHVIFLHTSRGINCPVTMALSRPHIFISIENTKPIKIHTESVIEKC